MVNNRDYFFFDELTDTFFWWTDKRSIKVQFNISATKASKSKDIASWEKQAVCGQVWQKLVDNQVEGVAELKMFRIPLKDSLTLVPLALFLILEGV